MQAHKSILENEIKSRVYGRNLTLNMNNYKSPFVVPAIRGIVQDIRFGHKDEDDPSSWNQPDVYHTIRIKEDFKVSNLCESLKSNWGFPKSISFVSFSFGLF